jgi:ABC-2 type transport system ATP-binding protein
MRRVKSVIAENLVKTYDKGKVRALNGLSLDVEEGTVLGVLGPNGAGKTTTVRILATLLTPDSGHATVAGIDVIKDPDRAIFSNRCSKTPHPYLFRRYASPS